MADLTTAIKKRAMEMGFVKVGIANVSKFVEEAEHLREWLRRGFHGTMGWMERTSSKRTDIRQVVPGAQSVVVVGTNYYTPVEHSNHPESAKISRYAWGDDYHDVIGPRLDVLCEFIKGASPDAVTRWYVDTGPVMEKVWASRAGIGWQGKHTNVITRDFGSWVFLGVVITDLLLQSDSPIEDLCGTCTTCIEACPTDAIIAPYQLDASKCISYLTIEHKGDIPDGLQDKFENWFFGCDICQDVCPWNRFQKGSNESAFHPRLGNITPGIRELGQMTEDQFSKVFEGSPVKRTKWSGLMRNVRGVEKGESNP